MITLNEVPGTNILEFTVDGDVTPQNFDLLIGKAEAMIAEHGKIRILECIVSFGKLPVSKFLEDIKFAFRHLKHIPRAALVTDKKWIEIMTKMSAPFVSSEIRIFELAELEQARAWLREENPA